MPHHSGSITDANTPWLAKLLHTRGVDLVRVEYVEDREEEIAGAVLRLHERVGNGGVVFTSGGIGATHDDLTYPSIAAAFGVQLALHQPTVLRMKEHYEQRGIELVSKGAGLLLCVLGSSCCRLLIQACRGHSCLPATSRQANNAHSL